MIDIIVRNKEVKSRLSKVFGRENVSVTGGRGTAWGWCEIEIKAGDRLDHTETYTQREISYMNAISDKAEEAIKGIEFFGYTDDMGSGHKEFIIQVRLKRG